MNSEQRRFFIKRVDAIVNKHIAKLGAINGEKKSALKPATDSVYEYAKKHPKAMKDELYNTAMAVLKMWASAEVGGDAKGGYGHPSMDLVPDSSYCIRTASADDLPIGIEMHNKRAELRNAIDKKYDDDCNAVRERAQQIKDAVMFAGAETDFLKMLQDFENTKWE